MNNTANYNYCLPLSLPFDRHYLPLPAPALVKVRVRGRGRGRATVSSVSLPTESTLISILRNTKSSASTWQVRQVHGLLVKTESLRTRLLYNAIIHSLSHSLDYALAVYRDMLLPPDHYTIPFLLKACALTPTPSRAFPPSQQLHALSLKLGLLPSNLFVANTLLRAYAASGMLSHARTLFHATPHPDLVTWTTLIQAYVHAGLPGEGLWAFFRMCDAGFPADERTMAIVLSACAQLGDLSLGRRLYAYILDNGVKRDVFVGNALVDMFFKCGDALLALHIFDQMPLSLRNVVSWNSLLLGLTHQGNFKEALRVFEEMQNLGVIPDHVTLVGVLNSCANLGLLESGKWVHAYIDKHNIRADGFVGNALIDMYSKCGSIGQSLNVFRRMKTKDVYSYTAIIVGLAMHGEAKLALDIFSDMSEAGVEPDQVTFVGVLSACSHAGLVEEGQRYFDDMSRVYGLEPLAEHFGCLVDLLGRAGRFVDAEAVIRSMPMEPDAFVWGSLLGACRIYGKVELGEHAMERLLKVEPLGEGAYVLMSNMYSSQGKWKDAVRVRKTMKEKYIKKVPGCSSIEIDGKVHQFRKGDKSHPKLKEIRKFMETFTSHLKNYSLEDV